MPCSSNLENITLKIGSLNLELWWEPASPSESSVPTVPCFGTFSCGCWDLKSGQQILLPTEILLQDVPLF